MLTAELYNSICFKTGEKPDLEKLKTLFYGNGKLVNNSGSKPQEYTVEQFCQEVMQQIEHKKLEAFHEKEVAHKTEVFSKVAQRFSTYEARFDADSASPFAVGVNCIQYIQVNGQWLITSMVWDDETK